MLSFPAGISSVEGFGVVWTSVTVSPDSMVVFLVGACGGGGRRAPFINPIRTVFLGQQRYHRQRFGLRGSLVFGGRAVTT